MKQWIFKILLFAHDHSLKDKIKEMYFTKNMNQISTTVLDLEIAVAELNLLDKKCTLQVWDVSRKSNHKFVRDKLLRGSFGAFLIFDIGRKETFEELPYWVDYYFSIKRNYSNIILVGLKSEAPEVTHTQIEAYAQFLETLSGKPVPYLIADDVNIVEIMATNLLDAMKDLSIHNKSIYDLLKEESRRTTLHLLRNHHLILDQGKMDIFSDANKDLIAIVITRSTNPDVVERGINHISDVELLQGLRETLDKKFHDLVDIRISKILEQPV